MKSSKEGWDVSTLMNCFRYTIKILSTNLSSIAIVEWRFSNTKERESWHVHWPICRNEIMVQNHVEDTEANLIRFLMNQNSRTLFPYNFKSWTLYVKPLRNTATWSTYSRGVEYGSSRMLSVNEKRSCVFNGSRSPSWKTEDMRKQLLPNKRLRAIQEELAGFFYYGGHIWNRRIP